MGRTGVLVPASFYRAGNQEIRNTPGITNINMSFAGGSSGAPLYNSHRYMTSGHVWDVAELFDAIKREL